MKRAFIAIAILLPGCFFHAEDHCVGCSLVYSQDPDPPAIPEGKTALVVLLHGAFGFGSEWDPIQAALHKRPELAFWAFVWPGPFGGRPPNRAEQFRFALQESISSLPTSAHEVLVLAHSAGGPLADYAARHIALPPGVKLHIVLLDPARISMAPYIIVDEIDTPMGTSLGAEPAPIPPLPSSVDLDEFRASDPPRHADTRVHYLGHKVTHGESVALGGLPAIAKLPR